MIHLYQWPSHNPLPNSGAFCMKLESYLRFMNIEHKVIPTTSLAKSPKKSMPFVEMDGAFMSDSRLIIEKLETAGPRSIDAHLTSEQKALSTAYIALLENHLVPILIYFRWFHAQGWEQFSRQIFAGAPSLIRILVGGSMRRKVFKSLHSNGISRHTEAEILSFARQDLSSTAQLLGTKEFVFGDQPCLLDLVIFSVVSNILHSNVQTPLLGVAQSHPTLGAHAERLLNKVYQRSFKVS